MLMGSKSREILKVRLDELSTYGLLSDMGTAYLNELFRSMHDGGLVFTQKGEYPLLSLTPLGEDVMLGKKPCRIVWPERHAAGISATKDSDGVEMEEFGFDTHLYARLKEVRARLAKQEGVPQYLVFNNKTLEHFTRLRPKSLGAGMRIKGVGEVKAEKYLQAFIDEIHGR